MTLNLTLLILMGVMFAVGIYLLLERSLTRVLLGIILISNGVNLLLLQTGGRAGDSPLVVDGDVDAPFFDPLPQALLLTAIVIAFALVSLMLALIYRSWVLARQDELSDDEEDRRVASQPIYDPEEDSEVPTETTEFAVEDLESSRLLNPRTGRDEDLPVASAHTPEDDGDGRPDHGTGR
ncbi:MULTISPECIES: Na(+)/H(+) antiporter subunit C [Nesterenkonia]|uniref:Multicomponent Na+:H+ antiporter subunit C n=1 Tax=Nesterenkonia xinjiangensis TaxID=225327 RepID=A0A7Z0KA51_9MICC|nr:Na(+)/H(+) antiporter subunit C [Nesterenkonia sp. PF2B19]NYJ78453.1 multicomponent Na+:H+ antiporter subunit C [Nesterenkonia xinjiangensis]OSM42758.1 Na(+)/H(+) antiporter subunit C [Nesterenkonia sp. PF2B19]